MASLLPEASFGMFASGISLDNANAPWERRCAEVVSMNYPSESEVITAENPPDWIDRHFLRQDPFIFSDASSTFHDIACRVASELEVDRNGIFCIGSGAIGLSVNPLKLTNGHLKRLDADSDLDLAIISARHFELAWQDLLRATQPHLEQVSKELEETLTWQRKRLFDGAILANRLLGTLSYGKSWIPALDRVSESITIALDRNVRVEAWVYRDYWSLRNYVAKGIVRCQKLLALSED